MLMSLFGNNKVSVLVQAAVTKYQTLGAYKQQKFTSHSFAG